MKADSGLPASAAPQSSQNADEGAFSAPHFGQRLDNGLPQVAQNFLPVVLSFPHLVQRIALPSERATDPFCIIRRRLATTRLRKDDHDTSRRCQNSSGLLR